MWLTTCAGSSFLHSSPSLQKMLALFWCIFLSLLSILELPAPSSSQLFSLQSFSSHLWRPSEILRAPAKRPSSGAPVLRKSEENKFTFTSQIHFYVEERKKWQIHIHIPGLTFALPVRVCDSVRHRICLLANFAAALLFRSVETHFFVHFCLAGHLWSLSLAVSQCHSR